MTSALLVIDVQNEVVEAIPARDELITTIAKLVDAARAAKSPVVWVQHNDKWLVQGSDGWQLAGGLSPEGDEPIFEKQHRSSFAGTGLGDYLRERGVDRLVLIGAQTCYCIDMAAKHALVEGFDVTWVSDAHGNGDEETSAGVVTDAELRALYNQSWRFMTHPERNVEAVTSNEIRW